jgi:hypothetical protein
MPPRLGRAPRVTIVSGREPDEQDIERQLPFRAPRVNAPSQNLVFLEPAGKQQRARREGQVVHNPNKGNRRPAAEEDAGDDGADGADEPSSSGRSEQTEQRNARRDSAWDALRPDMINDAYASAPSQQQRLQQHIGDQVQQLQERLDHGWAEVSHSVSCKCTMEPAKISSCELQYQSLTCTGLINVHTWKCHDCSATSTSRAIPNGCFPSSPVAATAWFDNKLLDFYGELGPTAGLSAKGVSYALDRLLTNACG